LDEIYRWLFYGLAFISAGIVSGLASGLFGIGGGLLRIPIFLYIFPLFGVNENISMYLAAGTSLALAIPSAITASIAQYKIKNLDMSLLKVWLPSVFFGVIIGLIVVRIVPGMILEIVFAIVVLILAAQLLFTGDKFSITKTFPSKYVLSIIALFIGSLSTMLGIGGGAFTSPVLSAFGYPIFKAIAIATVGVLVVSVFGAIGAVINGIGIDGRSAFSLGYIDVPAFILMTPVVMLTAPMGVRFGHKLSSAKIKKALAILLIVVGIDMLRNVI